MTRIKYMEESKRVSVDGYLSQDRPVEWKRRLYWSTELKGPPLLVRDTGGPTNGVILKTVHLRVQDELILGYGDELLTALPVS